MITIGKRIRWNMTLSVESLRKENVLTLDLNSMRRLMYSFAYAIPIV